MSHLHTTTPAAFTTSPTTEILVTRTELDYGSGLRGYVANKHWPAPFSCLPCSSSNPSRSGASRRACA